MPHPWLKPGAIDNAPLKNSFDYLFISLSFLSLLSCSFSSQ